MSDPAPAREAVSSALAADVVERVVANLELAVRAPRETLELCVLGLLAEGHLLIEDFPGSERPCSRSPSRAPCTWTSRVSSSRPTFFPPTSPA